jgi:hypothetical protein
MLPMWMLEKCEQFKPYRISDDLIISISEMKETATHSSPPSLSNCHIASTIFPSPNEHLACEFPGICQINNAIFNSYRS